MKSFDGIKKINTKNNVSDNMPGFSKKSVRDEQKRRFIKMAGIAGIGALLYSLIPKQAHGVIFGSSMRTDSVGVKNASNVQINPATEETLLGVAGLLPDAYDYISRSWEVGTFTETWIFKSGGSGGTTVATIAIVYDDVNMTNIVTVTKT